MTLQPVPPVSRPGKAIALPAAGFLAFVVLLAVLFLTDVAEKLDDHERGASYAQLASVIGQHEDALVNTVADYADWNEAYDHLHRTVDVAWAYRRNNLGRSIQTSFGYDYVMVFGPDGTERYGVHAGTLAGSPISATFDSSLAVLVARAGAAPLTSSRPMIGYAMVDHVPVMLAARRLSIPHSDATTDDGPPSVLVFGQTLSPAGLAAFGNPHDVSDLRVATDPIEAAKAPNLTIRLADDRKQFTLRWKTEPLGRDLLTTMLPVLALCFAALTGALLLLLRRVRQSERTVNAQAVQLAAAHKTALHQALHDEVTGLPNRRKLMLHLEGRLADVSTGFSVLFLDLDRFKVVNDTLGHDAGDAVLRTVADRLGRLPGVAFAARIGGDEFVLVSPAVTAEHLAILCNRLIGAVSAPIPHTTGEICVGASIGLAVAHADAADPSELLRMADLALQRAKLDGRGTYRFFASAMDEYAYGRHRTEAELRLAIKTDAFVLHYQPRIDIRSMTVVGVEALVRWNHPERGLVFPADFIPLAEETGQIIAIGQWVLQQACRDIVALDGLKVSVNLSPVQFRDKRLIGCVRQTLQATGLAPGRLELELTESALLEDPPLAKDILTALKALGVRLSMDDFGTGYSSLGYLQTLPFDGLKIDRCFITGIDGSGKDAAIVKAIANLANAMNLEVTAEGVETLEQLAAVEAAGCHQVQGYLLGRPTPLLPDHHVGTRPVPSAEPPALPSPAVCNGLHAA